MDKLEKQHQWLVIIFKVLRTFVGGFSKSQAIKVSSHLPAVVSEFCFRVKVSTVLQLLSHETSFKIWNVSKLHDLFKSSPVCISKDHSMQVTAAFYKEMQKVYLALRWSMKYKLRKKIEVSSHVFEITDSESKVISPTCDYHHITSNGEKLLYCMPSKIKDLIQKWFKKTVKHGQTFEIWYV